MLKIYSLIGFLTMAFAWALIIYALWRNQRSAARSPIVETTNFGPRIGAIIEVILHPDHAATWWRPAPGWYPNEDSIEGEDFIEIEDEVYLIKAFPTIGQDSSEIYGIRPDDGRVT